MNHLFLQKQEKDAHLRFLQDEHPLRKEPYISPERASGSAHPSGGRSDRFQRSESRLHAPGERS